MPAINYMSLNPLVTPLEVVQETFTNVNSDHNLIKEEVIKIAEIAHIRDSMGHDFYDFIKTNMNLDAGARCWDSSPTTCDSCDMGEGTNNGYQVWVDDYLKPALCWFVKFEALNDIQYNSGSAGIQMNLPEFQEPISPKVLNAYKQDIYRKAKLLWEVAINFLSDDDNDGCFPEFDNQVSSNDGYNCETGCDNSLATKNHGMIIY